ncbi:msrA [Symbiodinium necroappetens]|uniref:MsrA protein n=1 Tax=Symbiodinium necroappetens TaxID=1628268 RepID=A0A813BKI0_9DINO|nr:msrA [Symbiodinium necroappetens]
MTSLSAHLCIASSDVPGFVSRLSSCYGDKLMNCWYGNSDCTGSQMCSTLGSDDLGSCSAGSGGRYSRTIILGSDDEVAELCTTTTTTPFAGISGNISVHTDGACSTLEATYSVDLGPCTLTGLTTSQKFTCSEGSIAYHVYTTNDCSGEATTQVYEQGPCTPVENGTSSWIVTFPECTVPTTAGGAATVSTTAGGAADSAAVHLNIGSVILVFLACRYFF